MTSPPKPTTVVVGIDIGCETTKVVLGTQHSCEIVRSQTGMHTFPTAVSFDQKLRFVGETANQKSQNGILHLNRLLLQLNGGNKAEEGSGSLEDFYSFRHSTNNDDGGTTNVTVEYNGEEKTFTASQILAMFLGNIQTSVQSTIKRLENGSTTSSSKGDISYVITVEPNTPPTVHAQLLDAAYAAGLGSDNNSGVQIVESPAAYACCYQRKFPEFGASATEEEGEEEKEGDSGNKVVLIVDMGHGQTSVSVVKFSGSNSSSATPPEGEEATPTTTNNMTILSSKSSQKLGAGTVDVRLYNHFQSTLADKLGDGVATKSSRAGYRLLQGCHKLKHLLSQLPDGKVTVETIGKNDTDIALSLTREKLVELCQQDATTLQQLIQSTLDEAKVQTLDAVEVVGGGCRIPFVQTTIQEVLASYSNGSGPLSLSRSLDDTSAALGAALAGEKEDTKLLVTLPEPTDADKERRQQMRQLEVKMVELDTEEQVKADCRNQMEALILELRSAKHGKHASLLPSDNTLDDYLNTTEDWLFSEEADDSNREAMEQKLQDVQTKTQELCASYYKALAEEQALKDKEMEEAAAQAQLEKNGQPEGGEEDDHDNRRLPKKRRMEIVMKNKSEANELFKDGNYRFAAARYTKALTHCAKFVDLNPDDIKEVTDLKVTLNLNLALAYSKLSNFDQCLRVCNEAISLDDASLKAYYRRASVYYEKKQWDNAKADIVKAKKLPGGDTDKAIQKLSDRIDLQLKKQKQKEKKMASKMFG